jgi:hypothetical protein
MCQATIEGHKIFYDNFLKYDAKNICIACGQLCHAPNHPYDSIMSDEIKWIPENKLGKKTYYENKIIVYDEYKYQIKYHGYIRDHCYKNKLTKCTTDEEINPDKKCVTLCAVHKIYYVQLLDNINCMCLGHMRYQYTSNVNHLITSLNNKNNTIKLNTCLQCGHHCHNQINCASDKSELFSLYTVPCQCTKCYCIECAMEIIPTKSCVCFINKREIMEHIVHNAVPYKYKKNYCSYDITKF